MWLVSKCVPLVPVQGEGIFVKSKSILNINCVLEDVIWVNWVLTVDPHRYVVSPVRYILSVNHFSLLSPLSVWKNPISVYH
jgi:hypothetical protein